MRLVTFRTSDRETHAGVVRDEHIITLDYPTVLELLRDEDGLAQARRAVEGIEYDLTQVVPPLIPEAPIGMLPLLESSGEKYNLNEVVLLTPIPEPPSVRD